MLSSCLNLEWLGLRKCTLPHKVHISGLFSLEFLSINSRKDVKEIELSAVNLSTFELADIELKKLLFPCVPKLKNVHLSSCIRKLDEQYVLHLAKDLPQIEMLTFSLHTPKVEYTPTTFSNVLQLNLFVRMVEEDYNFAWSIIPLLRAFPILKKLYLKVTLHKLRWDLCMCHNIWLPPGATRAWTLTMIWTCCRQSGMDMRMYGEVM